MQFKFNEIPVSSRLDETVTASLNQIKREKRKNARRKLLIGCGSMAAAFAAAIIFCVSNPALAAKLPIIGSLFAGLEDDFTYAGDYSDRAQVLTPPETSAAENTSDHEENERAEIEETSDLNAAAQAADNPYSVTDNGLTLTAAEIYSDGLSIFLSLQIHSEEPFGFNYQWDENTGELLQDESGNLIPLPATVYPIGQAIIDSEEVTFGDTSLFVEQLDEHNFNGMIKTDLPASMFGTDGNHTMQISLRRFSADFCDENGVPIVNEENVADTALQIDGSWNLELPFTSDTKDLQVYKDLASSGEPYQITDVYVSPYQILVHYTTGTDQWGAPDEGGVVCFDENGTLLEKGHQLLSSGMDAFALNKRRPSELRFYVIGSYEYTDDSGAEPAIMDGFIAAHKIKDEATAKERAVNTFTLPLSW